MLKVLNKRERIILYLTVIIVGGSVFFNFFIGPYLAKNSSLSREIAFTRQKLKKFSRLISQKAAIESRYNRLALHSEAAIPQGDVLVETLSELERLAQGSGIHIIDIRPQDSSREGGLYKEIAVDVRTEGEMAGYFKFIYNLENSLSLLCIRRFQLGSRTNSNSLEGSFSISSISSSD